MRPASALTVLAVASCRLNFDELPVDAGSAAVCAPLPAGAQQVQVDTALALETAVMTATPGTTIMIADGTYMLSRSLVVTAENVTLRSASDEASRVILDGGGVLLPIVKLMASGATVVSLTLTNSPDESLVVEPLSGDITNNLIYDVTFADSSGPRIRIRSQNGLVTGPFADGGTVACSRFLVKTLCGTDNFGIVGVAARGWTVRDNFFDRRNCTTSGFRNVTFDRGSRDTIITNNVMLGFADNIMLGGQLASRTYPDALPAGCSGVPDHWGGLVCNNVISAPVVPPRALEDFDHGVAAWFTCDTWVVHNTVVSPQGAETFGNLESRFAGTYMHFVNNLVSAPARLRDGGGEDPAYAASNLIYQGETDFVDVSTGDVRLTATAGSSAGVSIEALNRCTSDAAGKPRNLAEPTVGAFERSSL